MTYQSPYGKIAGLRERLDTWIETLATDKTYPWIGTGIIDDLEAAGRYMDGKRTDEGINYLTSSEVLTWKQIEPHEEWDL